MATFGLAGLPIRTTEKAICAVSPCSRGELATEYSLGASGGSASRRAASGGLQDGNLSSRSSSDGPPEEMSEL